MPSYIIWGHLGFAALLALIEVFVLKKLLKSLPKRTTGYIKRTDGEIVSAWEKWLEGVSEPDKKHLSYGLRVFSDREFVQAIKDGDEEIRNFAIGGSRILAKELGTDPVEDILNSRP